MILPWLGGGFKYFDFHPFLAKWSNLTDIFQLGWNHQLDDADWNSRKLGTSWRLPCLNASQSLACGSAMAPDWIWGCNLFAYIETQFFCDDSPGVNIDKA